ncbi:MAG: zf-TFIIB domain-containing protein [Dehalococcoidia bacterium]
MQCPRDNTELVAEKQMGIEVDRCPSCKGLWLDHEELDQLESTVASTAEERRATIEFGERKSDLRCPVCERVMTVFNYRAYDLELERCPDEHGFWLDAGEEGRVRDVIADRVRGLARAQAAEAGWGRFLGGLRGKKR